MLVRAHQEAERIALVFVDLDNFKDVNDTLGHSAGDEVLQKWQTASRRPAQRSFVARYGGDEFVILLYGTHEAVKIHRDDTLAAERVDLAPPSLWQAFPFISNPAWASPGTRRTAAMQKRFCAMPTRRCTAQSPKDETEPADLSLR